MNIALKWNQCVLKHTFLLETVDDGNRDIVKPLLRHEMLTLTRRHGVLDSSRTFTLWQ